MYSKFLIENINRNLFITSDPQFGSQGVFDHVPARKLYSHINKLHRAIVDNWNSVIGAYSVLRLYYLRYRWPLDIILIYENDYDDCRYPVEKAYLRDPFDRYHCDVNIHEHMHNRSVKHPDCLSVCMEQTLFTPVKVKQFLSQHLKTPEQKIA